MKTRWSRATLGLVAGCALVAATNAVVLLRVAAGRGGEQTTMELTENELEARAWRWNADDDSGVELAVQYLDRSELSGDALAALGFDLGEDRGCGGRQRPAWGALELAGAAWEAWKEEERLRLEELLANQASRFMSEEDREHTRRALAHLGEGHSRLFLVAVEPRRAPLAERYAADPKVAVVPVLVSCDYQAQSELGPPGKLRRPGGYYGEATLQVSDLQVPAAFRAAVDRTIAWQRSAARWGGAAGQRESEDEHPPGYRATVAWGRSGLARFTALVPEDE